MVWAGAPHSRNPSRFKGPLRKKKKLEKIRESWGQGGGAGMGAVWFEHWLPIPGGRDQGPQKPGG